MNTSIQLAFLELRHARRVASASLAKHLRDAAAAYGAEVKAGNQRIIDTIREECVRPLAAVADRMAVAAIVLAIGAIITEEDARAIH